MSKSKMIKTCKTFENEREAAIFMLGFDLGTVAQNASARIDPEEEFCVLLDMTEDDEADFTLEAIKVNALKIPAQTIVIHLDGGLVQDVISERPLSYIVADTDLDGTEDDDRSKTPPALFDLIAEREVYKPRHIHPSNVNATAVLAMVELHEKVSAE